MNNNYYKYIKYKNKYIKKKQFLKGGFYLLDESEDTYLLPKFIQFMSTKDTTTSSLEELYNDIILYVDNLEYFYKY